MLIFPAIDLYGAQAVRLLRGDYRQMTVYSKDPYAVACRMREQGAACLHMVDLEGARDGTTPNAETVLRIARDTGLFTEIGGGIRSMEVLDRDLGAGLDRAILGTAAVKDRAFLESALEKYGSRIAVGVDIRDGYVAIKGWTERSGLEAFDFCRKLQKIGVKTLICTDISRDGAMQGTNLELYRQLSDDLDLNITASGGVSDMNDVKRLASMGLYGAIIGKAYYTGDIDLKKAIEVSR